jgi:hypothetical protein
LGIIWQGIIQHLLIVENILLYHNGSIGTYNNDLKKSPKYESTISGTLITIVYFHGNKAKFRKNDTIVESIDDRMFQKKKRSF